MMKLKFSYLLMFVASIAFLGSCNGLKKMADKADQLGQTVSPNPLEMHAEQVKVKVAGKIPPKYFDKKAILVVTPVLKYGTKEYTLETYTLQGESVKDNNDKVISYANGGSFSYDAEFPYVDDMRVSDLELRMQASRGSDKAQVITIPIAKGINVTPRLVRYAPLVDGVQFIEMDIKQDERITSLQKAVILYDLQKSNLKRGETKKEDVQKLIDFLVKTTDNSETQLVSVEVASYASPDGPQDLNSDLVNKRGDVAQQFVKKNVKNAASSKVKEANFIVKETTPVEDWEGFKKEVEASNVQDKELILRVLSMYSDPEVREREIKNISQAYTDLKSDILPKLRRSEIKANFQTNVKTDQELKDLVKANNYNDLKRKETLYAAKIVEDIDSKKKLYNKAIADHPDCYLAYNNLGVVKVQEGELDAAKADFEKSNELKANNPAVLNNLGAIAFAQGDMEGAEKYFEEAKANGCTSPKLGYNMGIIDIIKGQYPQAVQHFGSEKSYGKALALTLNKQNTEAESTLNQMSDSKSEWFYYLKAIVAAKLDKELTVVSNLKKAVEINPKIAEYAKGDVEFIKFWEISDFKSIVE